MDKDNYSIIDAAKYAKCGLRETHFLAFKYIPSLIKKYSTGIKTLDYGCGSGRSTRFLKNLNLEVKGVDIDKKMISEAIKSDDSINYFTIESAQLPMPARDYDVVFSSLVMLKIPTKKELLKIFNEIHRCLKDNGVFIFVTNSEQMYSHPWLSLDANYEENTNLKSGSLAKILLKDINLEIRDYYWTSDDYKEIISKSNFCLKEKLYPLGDTSDGYPWISENSISPYVIYVLRKNQE